MPVLLDVAHESIINMIENCKYRESLIIASSNIAVKMLWVFYSNF